MKILIVGFLAFFGWSTFSTYTYVCKIKGLCNEPVITKVDAVNTKNNTVADTSLKPVINKQVVYPETLTIYFAFDKSEFNSDAESDKYFNVSNAFLDQSSQARLSITGYTDAIGTEAYNQALGYRRAQRLQQYFESKGMPANRIMIESKGEKGPADVNSTTAGRANNRRTEITIKK